MSNKSLSEMAKAICIANEIIDYNNYIMKKPFAGLSNINEGIKFAEKIEQMRLIDSHYYLGRDNFNEDYE